MGVFGQKLLTLDSLFRTGPGTKAGHCDLHFTGSFIQETLLRANPTSVTELGEGMIVR